MSIYTKIFKQTAIYGLAAVFPKVIGFFLVPFHTTFMQSDVYGQYNIVYAIIMFCNVILAFGMETAFFRFYNLKNKAKEVFSNSLLFLFGTTTLFLVFSLLTKSFWASLLNIPEDILTYVIWILVFDALVIIPFSKLRADQRPLFYSIVRISNVTLNTSLNVFFLYFLPLLSAKFPNTVFNFIYVENYQVAYIFLANLIASLATLFVFYKDYLTIRFRFEPVLVREMVKYGVPIMIGGLAFAINESFDKLLLERLLPKDVALSEVGKYAACYKLGLFMMLFRQAYTLGIEPFFFSYAKERDAPIKYAMVTKYFVILGSLIMLGVIVFADILKYIMIPNSSYWDAMQVVPLIILANFCLGIYTNLSVWYKLRDQTMMGAYISIFGAIITLVLNYLLIPLWGYMGSAIATLCAYGSMMLISYILGQKYYPIPYEKKLLALYMGGSVLLSYVYFYFFRENYFIGIIFIALFTWLVYRQEKELIFRFIKVK